MNTSETLTVPRNNSHFPLPDITSTNILSYSNITWSLTKFENNKSAHPTVQYNRIQYVQYSTVQSIIRINYYFLIYLAKPGVFTTVWVSGADTE